MTTPTRSEPPNPWSLTTPSARVLVCIVRDPTIRMSDIATATGLALRTVHGIIDRLELDGALARRREGRRNVYSINRDFVPGDPLEATAVLGDWLGALENPGAAERPVRVHGAAPETDLT